MFGQVFFELINVAGRPVVNKVGVLFVGSQNRISHRKRDRSVSARKRRKPFVTGTCRVRKSHIERNHFGPVIETTVLDSIGKRNVSLVGFESV